MINLSEDQGFVFEKISNWLANGGVVVESQTNPMVLTLGGFAGTGKTTIVSSIAKEFNSAIRFAFCALSGRASSILANKLKDKGVAFDNWHYCGTIHSLIYKAVENEDGEVIYWDKRSSLDYDVIVVDEASMISEDIFNDIKGYNLPILAVGDHGQLPPIEGKFSLMKSPDLRLEKIHRQAEGNPIINLSMEVRMIGKIPSGYVKNDRVNIVKKSEYVDFIKTIYSNNPESNLNSAVLCYKNATRSNINSIVRKNIFGNDDRTPSSGDIVVCLKNVKRYKSKPLYNGYRGILSNVKSIDGDFISSRVSFPHDMVDTYLNNICKHQFCFQKTFSSFSELELFGMNVSHWSEVGVLFDYGYAMTVHKFQGSSAENVILFNERPAPVSDEDYKRWLYTGVSRSSDRLTIII